MITLTSSLLCSLERYRYVIVKVSCDPRHRQTLLLKSYFHAPKKKLNSTTRNINLIFLFRFLFICLKLFKRAYWLPTVYSCVSKFLLSSITLRSNGYKNAFKEKSPVSHMLQLLPINYNSRTAKNGFVVT